MHPHPPTYFKVANHLFAVACSDTTLLSHMPNYQPFCNTEGEPIFLMEIEQNGLLSATILDTWQYAYTNTSNEDMPRIEVYRGNEDDNGRDWLMRISKVAHSPICCELQCSTDFTRGQLRIIQDYPDIRFCIDNALMLLYAFRTAAMLTLEMHAAVVVKDQKAYLFLGHSGTGKSTHARQWLAAYPDARLLNDDNPIVRMMPNGEVVVYGSPWSGKTACYKNEQASIAGIIQLSQAPANTIQRLSMPQAYASMISSVSGLKKEEQMADELFQTIQAIITTTPCYHLACLPNTAAAELCYQTLTTQP